MGARLIVSKVQESLLEFARSEPVGRMFSNLIGIVILGLFDVWSVVPRADPINEDVGFGPWVLVVFIVLTVFLVVNSIWLIQIWAANRPIEGVEPFGPWLFMATLWLFPLCLGLSPWIIASGLLLLIGQHPLWYYW